MTIDIFVAFDGYIACAIGISIPNIILKIFRPSNDISNHNMKWHNAWVKRNSMLFSWFLLKVFFYIIQSAWIIMNMKNDFMLDFESYICFQVPTYVLQKYNKQVVKYITVALIWNQSIKSIQNCFLFFLDSNLAKFVLYFRK